MGPRAHALLATNGIHGTRHSLIDMAEDLHARACRELGGFRPRTLRLGDRRRAAVGVVLVVDDQGRDCFVLTRRSAGLRGHAGQWALPGGKLDLGESAWPAATRELSEEVDLAVDDSARLGRLDDYPTRSGFVITPFVVWGGTDPTLRANPDEVASIHLVPIEVIDVEPRFVSIPESTAPVIQLPIFDRLVHAPTAAVLYQFREVVLHGRATRVAHLEQPVFAWR